MIRLILATSASVLAIFSSSCGCCTSDVVAPGLRPLPQFREILTERTEIDYTK